MSEDTATQVEQALLGCILTGFPMDSLTISGGDFYQPRHELIWDACAKITAEGRKPDPMLVAATLGTDVQRAGGHVYLADLIAAPSVGSHATWYAEQVAEQADRRRMRDAAQQAAQLADQPGRVEDLMESCRALFDRPRRGQSNLSSLATIVPRLVDLVQDGKTAGLSTPWPDLDRWIRGLHPGLLYVIGARPGVGKSLIGQNLAAHFSRLHDLSAFVASLEMPEDELGTRFLAADSGVDMGAMETGNLSPRQWELLAQGTSRLMQSKVAICDDSWQSMATIRAAVRDVARRGDLGLVVIDYMQLVKPHDSRVPREQQVAEISRDCKRIAKEFGVPLVALAQLNRASASRSDKTPTLTDLRESGAIEADADVVALLHREEPTDETCQVHIAKNRSGPLGRCELIIQGAFARVVSSINHSRE